MTKVIADITMSLDGFVTSPSGDVDEIHAWVMEQDPIDTEILEVLLGGGTPLFRAGTSQRYRQRDVRPSRNAVHLTYERLIGANG